MVKDMPRHQANSIRLKSALNAMINDLEATYEVAKHGKVAEISIGQFGRLRRAKDLLNEVDTKTYATN